MRAGQLAADSEFILSQYGGLFVNATFGWPAITAANLPNGGPAYPTATPAVRVKVEPLEGLSILAAVFNGDPVGPGGTKDPQRRDRSGFEFRTTDPPLFIGEAAYTYNKGKGAAGLPARSSSAAGSISGASTTSVSGTTASRSPTRPGPASPAASGGTAESTV